MFNLVHDPWLPVEQTDGSLTNVSIHQALTRAHTFRRLVHASPVVLPSMHRLLLAILHRALRGPEDAEIAAEWFEQGRFPADKLEAYLEQWQDRFELFHAEQPFYQVANLQIKKRKTTSVLVTELASGTNKLLFDHTHFMNSPELSFVEATQLLIAKQTIAFPEGGGGGYTSSPVGTNVVVLVLGNNLFETLLLNMIPYTLTEHENDYPIWEGPRLQASQLREIQSRKPKGLTDRYTWLTRMIKFEPNFARRSVSYLHYAQGIKPITEFPYHDPMIPHIKLKKKGIVPLKLNAQRSLWRDFQALVPYSEIAESPAVIRHAADIYSLLDKKTPMPLLVCGLLNSNQKAAKLILWRKLEFFLPPKLYDANQDNHLLLQRLLDFVNDSYNILNNALESFAVNLLTMGERSLQKKDIDNLVASLPSSAYFWSQLERHFPELLEKFSETYANQLTWWKDTIANVIGEAWQLAVKSAGENERAWRAASKSGGIVGKYIKELKEAA